jgi:peptide/nickel transport system substrate-binding protein
MEIKPELAVSWKIDTQTFEWTFILRDDVTFHNGKPFSSEDVIYTFKRLKDPEVGSPAKAVLDNIKEVVAKGPHAVIFRMKDLNVDFPYFLGDYQMKIVPKGFTDFDKAVGTGPFMLKEYKPGIRMLAVKNPNYWKKGLPYLDEVESLSIPDPIARFNALMAGDVDCIAYLDPKLISRAKKTDGIKIIETPSGFHTPFVMNTTTPPYNDPRVRKALKLLIDREKYAKIVYKGYATVANDQPIPQADIYHCDDIEQHEYSPDKAKALLKEAGKLDYTFELYTGENLQGGVDGAMVFQQMATKAGVNVKVVRAPADGYWSAVWMKKPFFMAQWYGRATANLMLGVVYKSDAPWNESSWKRPEFDDLLTGSQKSVDESLRQEYACKLQKMIHDDGGTIIPCFISWIDATTDKVHGITPHPLAGLGGLKFAETAWIER